MANRYDSRSVYSPKRSQVDLSCEHLTTMDFFRLQPIYCCEQIAGNDTFNVSVNTFIESSPFAQRVYGSIHLDLHAFFVPYQLVYEDWNNFFFGNNNTRTQNYQIPYCELSVLQSLSLNNHDLKRMLSSLGYPVYSKYKEGQSFNVSLLPLLCYNRIWWDYYRDSANITDSDFYMYNPMHGGRYIESEVDAILSCFNRTFKKDPITTLIKNPQLGSAAAADVVTTAKNLSTTGTNEYLLLDNTGKPIEVIARDGTSKISRDVSIPILRGATALQRYLERLGITGGTRALERLIAEFGVESPRIKYNMCDFIGSKRVPVQVQGLQNTSSSMRQADIEGHTPFGIVDNNIMMGQRISTADAISQSQTFSHTAKEQGLFIVMASIMPEFNYYNNLDPLFTRGISHDGEGNLSFYRPDFQDTGYEECLLSEVRFPHAFDADVEIEQYDPFQVVGYRPKYESYRYKLNQLSGDFLEYYSENTLFKSVFTRPIFNAALGPADIQAGLALTTPDFYDRMDFDKYFSIVFDDSTGEPYDHFVCRFAIQNNAIRPITSATLPEELTHVLNAGKHDVAFGGVRL